MAKEVDSVVNNYFSWRGDKKLMLLVLFSPGLVMFILFFISFDLNYSVVMFWCIVLALIMFFVPLSILALRNIIYLLSIVFFVTLLYCMVVGSASISHAFDYLYFFSKKDDIDAVVNFAKVRSKHGGVVEVGVDNDGVLFNSVVFDDRGIIDALLVSKAKVPEDGLNPGLSYRHNGMAYSFPKFNKGIGAADCALSEEGGAWTYACPTFQSGSDYYAIEKITDHYYWLKLYQSAANRLP